MREKIYNMLKTTGLEVVYRTWDEGKDLALPNIAYHMQSTDNINADNVAYIPVIDWVVELYCSKKDDEAEKKVEQALTTNGHYFNKNESQIEKGLLMITYTFTTIGE